MPRRSPESSRASGKPHVPVPHLSYTNLLYIYPAQVVCQQAAQGEAVGTSSMGRSSLGRAPASDMSATGRAQYHPAESPFHEEIKMELPVC
ncbi:hypothetical protein PAPYR_13502 [Paratrimastix pyriformis]|uniref:Uncharacterized protein n=1 Tax=Paratrimastix pyriformis TaxID=342808 RepID=A0ABQ8U061_9EUKA|nr:hypothetical protein PAPYR_13502 [Paratrimastix pyriformis]